MNLTLSRPVQFALTTTLVGVAVALLRPPPVELPVLAERKDGPPGDVRMPAPVRVVTLDPPWLRPRLPGPIAAQAPVAQSSASGVSPLPAAGTPAGSDDPPPRPLAPAVSQAPAPDIVYLGRMIRDGKTQVFLAPGGGEPIVLSAGDVLQGSWAIQSISSTNVLLRHVDSGESLAIAMGGGSSGARPGALGGGPPGQVGRGFLGSGPAAPPTHPVD